MTTTRADVLLRHVRSLVADETGHLRDGQLLQRFADGRDEAASAALVRRHGPLVLGVCRRVLGDWHDGEDAFQTTFLTLAQKAGSIHKQGSVGPWLYGVAYRVAANAKTRAAARRRHECQAPGRASGDALAEVSVRELLAVLDEELRQLPACCPAPLVLCLLGGRTRDEAARQLGWSLSTLKRRLQQGRDRLPARPAKRR